jgi:hypothetical protein
MKAMRVCLLVLAVVLGGPACRAPGSELPAPAASGAPSPPVPSPPVPSPPVPSPPPPVPSASLPLLPVAERELPGRPTRFDYQDIDASRGRLVLSHMNDGEVLFVRLGDGAVLARLVDIPLARGVAVAGELGRVFVTSSPHTLVVIDAQSMTEMARTATGKGPDGVAWDATDQIVGVSDQGDGALSLISDAGTGRRRALKLGRETGNVVFDAARGWFWITVVGPSAPDRLVAVRPGQARVERTLPLPGCMGAHGLRLHPRGTTAFIACEENSRLLQIELDTSRVLASLPTGKDPDVLAIDPGLGWLYVAAESGDLSVFDVRGSSAAPLGQAHPGEHSHTVAVDEASHRLFFPLQSGAQGKPVLRVMKPTGT